MAATDHLGYRSQLVYEGSSDIRVEIGCDADGNCIAWIDALANTTTWQSDLLPGIRT